MLYYIMLERNTKGVLPMTKCSSSRDDFQPDFFPWIKGRKIKVDFNGGNVSSDGGVLLLKQIDRKLKVLRRAEKIFKKYDKRQKGKVRHGIFSMLVQRIYGIACGYEDLNDHHELRHDIAWQTAADEVKTLASVSTLCRFENKSIRNLCMELMELMIDVFIESFDFEPNELILDFDNTDDPVHGNQVGRFFHGYYDEYCFLPLYVFCGEKLVTALLQPSSEDGAKHAGVVLKIIVRKLRSKWPNVKIIYRGDSGFARPRHLYWCERNGVEYVLGIAKNERLKAELAETMQSAIAEYENTGEKAKLYHQFEYAADSWHERKRKVVGKAEFNEHGANPRFVLTTRPGDPQDIYEVEYCARGDMENRVKEQQLGLFSDRTSAHEWWTNQFRVLLSAFAYVLFERMRNIALKGTELVKAQVSTIRLKLLKIGAVVKRNTRSIHFSLSSSCPYQNLFWRVAEVFAPG
jgi:hypothetical protein